MNTFIGTITYTGNHALDHIDADCLEINAGDNNVLFLSGNTEYTQTSDLIDDFKKNVTWLVSWDISLSTEDELVVLNPDIEEDGLYECVSFEWSQVEYTQIVDRFHDIPEAMSVREAESSQKYGNRIVKVDFIY